MLWLRRSGHCRRCSICRLCVGIPGGRCQRSWSSPDGGVLACNAACGLVVVHVDALELEVGVATVGTGRVDAMLVEDDLS